MKEITMREPADHHPFRSAEAKKRYLAHYDLRYFVWNREVKMTEHEQSMLEIKYFGEVGFLFPYDIRYDPADRAFCNPLPGGRVGFRLHTEPRFSEATLVYNDGRVQAAAMALYGEDRRFQYWETTIRPHGPSLSYSFALKTKDGTPVYWCRHGVDHAVEPLDRWQLDLTAPAYQPHETPDWIKSAVVYQIFPDRFANGDPATDPAGVAPWGSEPTWLDFQGGDLDGIREHLGYLQELGIDVLYLNPINCSVSTHRYDAVDFRHVDPILGGDDAFHRLVEAAHRLDMRIILDASFNHCHPLFSPFQDILKHGMDSPYCDWFTIYEHPVVVRYRPHLIAGVYGQYLERFAKTTNIPLVEVQGDGPRVEPTYLAWYGVLSMPKLNQRNPETRAYFLDVATYWLREFDIDGWRMDVARHIEPDFWQEFRRVTKAAKPDCYLISEIWGNSAPWLQGDMFDATMNYIFRDLCLDYLAKGTSDTASFVDGISRMLALYSPQVTAVTQNLLSSHDTPRFLTLAGGDVRRFRLATLVQMTLPGAPGIYYGDEIGMQGGNDPGCRGAFPWHQVEAWDRTTLRAIRELIALRRRFRALREGSWRVIWQGEETFAYQRQVEEETLIIVVNRRGETQEVTVPCEPIGPGQALKLWGDGQVSTADGGILVRELQPWSGIVVRV